ncbi:MAG: CBS domain-containing protein [Phycisphaeraceae bacterium]
MGLREEFLHEPVSELKIMPGVVLPTTATVRQAIDQMRKAQQGCVIVVNDKGIPEGKFTEHQLAGLICDDRPSFMEKKIGHFVRDAWARMSHRDPIATLIHRLLTYGLRHVIVVDDEGKPLGVVGQRAIMEYIADYFPRAVKVQETDAKVAIENREGA